MRSPSRPPGIDIQGHRGARGLLPENTVESFLVAARFGVHALELDVVLTKDDQVIVSHEPWFSHHTCSTPDGHPIAEDEEKQHNIYQMDLATVRTYDCGARGHHHFPTQRAQPAVKPTLAEVVDAVDAACAESHRTPMRYAVEIKSRRAREGVFQPEASALAARVYQEVATLGLLGRCTIQSFDPRVVDAIRELDATVEIAFLVENRDSLEDNLARVSFTPDIYAPFYHYVDPALIGAVHERDMLIILWTVNEVEDMVHFAELGVDGLITDFPDRAAEVFELEPRG